ncbi:hypothetical protein TNCV_1808671 [Trichonephila clavipes]|nr:hypothetical protein TNCV_1808671 [Trichonephila clavipes]
MPASSSPTTIRNHTTKHCSNMDASMNIPTLLLIYFLYPERISLVPIACGVHLLPPFTSMFSGIAIAGIKPTQLHVATFHLGNP